MRQQEKERGRVVVLARPVQEGEQDALGDILRVEEPGKVRSYCAIELPSSEWGMLVVELLLGVTPSPQTAQQEGMCKMKPHSVQHHSEHITHATTHSYIIIESSLQQRPYTLCSGSIFRPYCH
jgi:hypothetical protein